MAIVTGRACYQWGFSVLLLEDTILDHYNAMYNKPMMKMEYIPMMRFISEEGRLKINRSKM